MSPTRLLLILPDPTCAHRVQRLLHAQAPGCEVLGQPHDCSQAALCRWLEELPARQVGEVQAALSEAIAVLEHSRQAFKSAQLAALRQRLSRLLEELSSTAESGTN